MASSKLLCKNDSSMRRLILFSLMFFAVVVSGQETQTQSRPAETSVYHHPAGLEFHYPSNWMVRYAQFGGLEMVPPDQQRNPTGITEGFFIWGIGGSFTGPADPTLISYLNKIILQMLPFLNQQDQIEEVQVNGLPGRIISWSGSSTDGVSITARCFALTNSGNAYTVIMLGSADRMAAREPSIREIFNSFRFTQATRDNVLVGNWSSTATPAQAQPGEPMLQIELRSNGGFTFKDSSASTDQDSGEFTGQWYSAAGRLCFVVPESFFLNFDYEMDGPPGSRKLTLKHTTFTTTLFETPSKKKQ